MFVTDKEILDVFLSFNDMPVESVADKPPSFVVVGGSCSSRVAVANRLLGEGVLPVPCCDSAWCTLEFVDTDCVSSNFCSRSSAAVKTLWSWFRSVPLVDVELNSDWKAASTSEDMFAGSVSLEDVQTVPVVNILMSDAILRAGCQLIVCGDHSCVSSIQFALTDVIPIIVFVVSGAELSEQVSTTVVNYKVVT